MSPLLRLLSVRYLLHRWDRAALVVASIALGVATLVSARILNRFIETAVAETTTPLRGLADAYITRGELGVRRSLADDIRTANVPGVASVQPLIFERITLPSNDQLGAVLVGMELQSQLLTSDNSLGVTFTRTLELSQAASLAATNTHLVVVSRAVFEHWQKTRTQPLAPFPVRFGSRTIPVVPFGVLDVQPESPLKQLGLNVVGMELAQASRFVFPTTPTDREPRVNRIDVTFDSGANAELVRAALRAIIGDRADVTTPETQGAATQEIVGGLQIGFLLCSAGAMVVGLFLVYNALSVTVAERRHDIGVLRSTGATRRQIVGLFTTVAVVLGVIGSTFGIPLGMGLARLAVHQFYDELGSIFLNPDVTPAWPTLATVALAMAAGVATAVLAALVPAVQASTAEPADAVRRSAGGIPRMWSLFHHFTCVALIGGGVLLVLGRHYLPARLGAFGGMMTTLTGLLLSSPILVGLTVRLVRPLLHRFLPIEARIAADNLTRSPGRTGVVIGALGAGVAVMIQTAGVGKSNEQPVVEWIDQVIRADQFLFAGNMAAASSSQAPFRPDDLAAMADISGVQSAVGVRYSRPAFNGTIVLMTTLDVAPYLEAVRPRVPGGIVNLEHLRSCAGREAVVMSDNFGRKHGLKVGDHVTLPGRDGPVSLPIVDEIVDYSWNRGTLFMDRTTYANVFGDDRIDAAHVFFRTPEDPTTAAGVRRFAAERAFIVQDRLTVRNFFAEVIDRVYTLAYLQQIVVGLVASLGVVTALLISVLQRKRELGVLLAVGATPWQVIRTVLAEAALMGFFGTLLGILFGIPMTWYVLKVIVAEESGFVFPLVFPWGPTVLIAIGSLSIATFAGLLPAWHAVKTRIPDAIQYE